MNTAGRLNVEGLVAIDTHVHVEPHDDGHAVNEAAREYFGATGSALAAGRSPSTTGRGRSPASCFPWMST